MKNGVAEGVASDPHDPSVKPLFNLALEFEAQNAGLFCVFHILNCRNPDGVCHTYGSNQSCMPGIRQILRRQFVVKPSRVTLVDKINPKFILKFLCGIISSLIGNIWIKERDITAKL